jgi:hypothetical protein
MKTINKKWILAVLCCFLFVACSKDKWLDAKRIKSDVKPETLKDYQAILDNNQWINGRFVSTGIAATDNLYLTDAAFGTLRTNEKEIYSWGNNPWSDNNGSSVEWNNLFSIIEYANVVLEGLDEIQGNSMEKDNIRGQALFYRSFALYNLALIFCRQYDPAIAATQKGLPLRTTSDVNILFQRSSLRETYANIISDCKSAMNLLPMSQPFITRPSKLAAYGVLSKVFLTMSDYEQAIQYATLFLDQKSDLLDFNSDKVSIAKTYRFPVNGIGNDEVIFYAYASGNGLVRPTTSTKANVDTILYRSYNKNDLRKSLFYFSNNTDVRFRGGYTGDFYNFCGIATNEILLIRAECLARAGDYQQAVELLNGLLLKRYKSGTFDGLAVSSSAEALNLILLERRKELPFTFNTRWDDIRRLSLDLVRKIEIKRILNGKEIILNAGSARYAFPIPGNEIQLSGIEQNDY